MRMPALSVAILSSMLSCGPLLMAAELKSGPQVGAKVPGPFHVVSVYHAGKPDAAGKKWDYVEQYGPNPTVLIFARTINDPLIQLIRRLDAEVASHKIDRQRLSALVVLLSEDKELEKKLKDTAEKHGIKHVSLAVAIAGPPKWNLAKDADVTIILYRRYKIEANYAFRKGDLMDTIGTVLADLPKITVK